MTFYRKFAGPALSPNAACTLSEQIQSENQEVSIAETEKVFCADVKGKLSDREHRVLNWLLANLHDKAGISTKPVIANKEAVEIGTLLNFETADSTNAVSICQAIGLEKILRIEMGRRYRFDLGSTGKLPIESILEHIRDQMTEGYYPEGLRSFFNEKVAAKVEYIPVLQKGMAALKEANERYGTGMDEADLNYYHYLFVEVYKRDPTDVEFCDLGNAFSEHSRHHIFNAKIYLHGKLMPFTLFEIIKATQKNDQNAIISFHDNGSAILGRPIAKLVVDRPGFPSAARQAELLYHYVLTVETHNHPCLIEAWNGAGTGGRGRVRDNGATGRGGIIGAGISGFMGGNLRIPGYYLPWENEQWLYDPALESPLSFMIKATEGDFYSANQHGEPLALAFAESYGFDVGGQRWENVKPIMLSGGLSFLDSRHVYKAKPQKGMLVIKSGGNAFRIGLGGGAASSMLHGQNKKELDWDSVQRVNGEMAGKIQKLVETYTEMGGRNPIRSIEDQGAGGLLNCVKELVEPAGAKIYLLRVPLGDKTLSAVEILVSEYQECMYFLINPEDWELVSEIADNLSCPCDAIGTITDDGKITVIGEDGKTAVEDLELKHLFAEYPQKEFHDERVQLPLKPLEMPSDMTVRQAMELMPRLLGVASKEWMAHIVDRAVRTTLAQQMCVGPAQLPICHYAVTAPSNFSRTGQVSSVGHRPPIGLISPVLMSRMAVVDAMTGLMGAPITSREDIKMSANWMLAAKLPGGMAWLYDAAIALRDVLAEVKADINGGKDSLSLATKYLDQLIRSLNTLVLTLKVGCPDYSLKLTPEIKRPGESRLMFVDLALGHTALGGSAFAQTLRQTGADAPDLRDANLFCAGFDAMQEVIRKEIALAYQKRVRGGLIQTVCEMAYAANCGVEIGTNRPGKTPLEYLFNEEAGGVLEYLTENENQLIDIFSAAGLEGHIHILGESIREKRISLTYNGKVELDESMPKLRDIWRNTSYQLKKRHKVPAIVEQERKNLYDPVNPTYKLAFDPDRYPAIRTDYPGKPRVAILEEEGCNSRQEMMDFAYMGGFEPWFITMRHILKKQVSLRWFRGLMPVPGFSFKDVFGAGKGWAAVWKFNDYAYGELADFLARPDTWIYAPCNAAQMMLYLDIILGLGKDEKLPLFVHNNSEGFESRQSSARIFKSPAIGLRGMEGSVLPVHTNHGEGRLYSPDPRVIQELLHRDLCPIRFVDMYGAIASEDDYPFNPNGSPYGITGLCDPTGRFLVMMPHPDRIFLPQHHHYLPREWSKFKNGPWLRIMHNLKKWTDATPDQSTKPPAKCYAMTRD